jgi:hypothetical protein
MKTEARRTQKKQHHKAEAASFIIKNKTTLDLESAVYQSF